MTTKLVFTTETLKSDPLLQTRRCRRNLAFGSLSIGHVLHALLTVVREKNPENKTTQALQRCFTVPSLESRAPVPLGTQIFVFVLFAFTKAAKKIVSSFQHVLLWSVRNDLTPIN
jgi:hypothetical protein